MIKKYKKFSTRKFLADKFKLHNFCPYPRVEKKRPDYILMATIGIIVVFGLVALASASNVYSFEKYNNAYWTVLRQIFHGLIPGLILFFIFYKIDYRHWIKFNIFWMIASIGLLILVFVPGIGMSYGKARSWAHIGINFQPSEIVKLTFILYLAGWCFKKGREKIADFAYGFVPFMFFLILILGLIALQPDNGTMLVMATIAILIFFAAGAKISHLGWLALIGAAASVVLILKKSYLINRLMAFLNPELDTQGISYHINQAILAIGSGGWFGRGFGKSHQKLAYLPEVSGDSIFAIIAEEMGFLAVVLLIALFLILMYRGFMVAKNASDGYGRLLAVGIVSWFIFQTFLNIAVISGLMPMTGIPLPFISYGGTALTAGLGAAGLLLNISKKN